MAFGGIVKPKIIIMENFGKITVFLIGMVVATLVSFLGCYVMIKIATLYELKFILEFSFIQIYGITCVFNIMKYKHKDFDESQESKKDFDSMIKSMFSRLIRLTVFYLLGWFISWLVFLAIS